MHQVTISTCLMQQLQNLCRSVKLRSTANCWTGFQVRMSQYRIHDQGRLRLRTKNHCVYGSSASHWQNCFTGLSVSPIQLVSKHILTPCSYSYYQNYSSRSSGAEAELSSESDPSSKIKPTHFDHHSIVKSLKKLENSLRVRGYSTLRIGVGIVVAIGVVVYLLRDPIRENVAEEVSQVASRSLEHEHVVGKAEEFAKSLLSTILHDENIHRLASQFIKQVLDSPETREASIEYISNILEDPQTRQLLAATIKQVLLLAINDPETTAALKAVVVLILSDAESQKAARELITAVFRHEELKAVASVFFADVLKSPQVINQAAQLGKEVTYRVVTDPDLKEETGKSLWQAVKYSVTPSWFSKTSKTSSTSATSEEVLSTKPSSEVRGEPQDEPKTSPKPIPESSMPPAEDTSSGDATSTGQESPHEEVMDEEPNIMT